MARAIFLDRDGTVMFDRGYLRDPAGVEILARAAETLKELSDEGWKLFILSNQSGVGRGLMTLDEMYAVHSRFLEEMLGSGVRFDASYLCTHGPDDACQCRKPATHFIRRAVDEHGVDTGESWMIGDRQSDVICGRNAGCRTIWLRNPNFAVHPDLPDFVAGDWNEIRAIIGVGRPHRNSSSH